MKKKHEYVTGILTEAKIEPLENFNFMNYLHFYKITKKNLLLYLFFRLLEIISWKKTFIKIFYNFGIPNFNN